MNAFEITPQDVENVLRANCAKISDARGRNLATMAEDIFDNWAAELSQIEAVALNGGTELEDQTDAAYAEIHRILVEQGILTH